LQQLVDLYRKTELPVHYETLAEAVGVSKWTAYDVLKAVEKQGLVSRRYANNAKETGRSQVMFVPTAKAEEVVALSESKSFDQADWNTTLANITRMLKELKHTGINEALRKLLDETAHVNGRFTFCAYTAGLLVYLKNFSGKSEAKLRPLMKKAPSKETGMTMMIGTVLATTIQKVNEELGREITELVSRFLGSIPDLTGEEKEKLFDLLSEAY
jgi:predicted transcriptional regulator